MARFIFLALLVCSCARTITEADKQNARIHHDIAISNLERGDTRGALRELQSAEKNDPKQPETQHVLGLVYQRMGRYKEALLHYEQAVSLRPNYSEAYNNLGTLYLELGRLDEAISSFEKALSDILYATPSLALGNMGFAYYKKGELELAEKHLLNAVTEDPKFCRGYEWLVLLSEERNQFSDIELYCQRFFKHCKDDPVIAATIPPDYVRQMYYFLAMAYVRQGQREKAKATLKQCAVDDADAVYGMKCQQALRRLP